MAAHCSSQLDAIEHLTDEQRKIVIDKVQLGSDMMAALRKEIDTKPKHEDPTTTLAEVDKKIDILVAETKAIFSTPPPKVEAPKPDETKAEEEMPAAEEVPASETKAAENEDMN